MSKTAGVLPTRYRYIAIEGPIGVGKSTLAEHLSTHYKTRLVLEDVGANPFLGQFYRDMKRHALATQMFFLFHRVNQLTEMRQPDLFEHRTVADYMLAKDTLFAQLTLDDNEYQLYTQLYQHLQPQVPEPDLVIYLQAPVDTLMARIQRRARPIERGITPDYLERLSEAYNRFFYDYSASPLLVVNSEHLNFADDVEHQMLLRKRIEALRGQREYLNAG